MELTLEVKKMLVEGAKALKGADRRLFMARAVNALDFGGQRLAERELGWDRNVIRKGMKELEAAQICQDGRNRSGRKKIEEYLPNLRKDIKEIVDSQSQADPKFETTRLYRRITVAEVMRQLVSRGYDPEDLPCAETIRGRLAEMGYHPSKVQKSKPKKKIPETDEIFEWVWQVNKEAEESSDELQISMDAKAKVKVGPFSRGGKSRVVVEASDHDFQPEMELTPFGILLPQTSQTFIYMVESKVTADCIVDILSRWWRDNRKKFPLVSRLVINMDNGPECHSRRTQFIKRIIEFCDKFGIGIRLAYYPPYHSKYNPIERVWAVLENEWNGDLLDSAQAVLGHAKAMTWKGIHPVVKLVKKVYKEGKKVSKKSMEKLEERLERWPGLEKWFVDITYG